MHNTEVVQCRNPRADSILRSSFPLSFGFLSRYRLFHLFETVMKLEKEVRHCRCLPVSFSSSSGEEGGGLTNSLYLLRRSPTSLLDSLRSFDRACVSSKPLISSPLCGSRPEISYIALAFDSLTHSRDCLPHLRLAGSAYRCPSVSALHV